MDAEADAASTRKRQAVPIMEEHTIHVGIGSPVAASFSDPDTEVPKAAVDRIIGMIRLAAEFGERLNGGRGRGLIYESETVAEAGARGLGRCRGGSRT